MFHFSRWGNDFANFGIFFPFLDKHVNHALANIQQAQSELLIQTKIIMRAYSHALFRLRYMCMFSVATGVSEVRNIFK